MTARRQPLWRLPIALVMAALVTLSAAAFADAAGRVYCTRHQHPRGCIKIPTEAKRPTHRKQQPQRIVDGDDLANGGGVGGGPGDHTEPALAWADSQRKLTRWAWYCELFVEEAFGTQRVYDSAMAAQRAMTLHRESITKAP